MKHTVRLFAALMAVAAATLVSTAGAQDSQPSRRARFGPPPVKSPEVTKEGKITFRLFAPKAETVRLSAGDIPGNGMKNMEKGENDIWEVTVGPVDPGAYRYRFDVDGVGVVDPNNPTTSESNAHTWSLVYVPGTEWMDAGDVPHGAIAEISYQSKTLGRLRRMHVYTPPGYEANDKKYPVFYLLHGAFDCDDSWSTVGRAGFILDKLIAEKKAEPMVVVMPAGHTGPFSFGGGGGLPIDEFSEDFQKDVMPYIESHYRVKTDRANRAIAGLSMGGAQTLNVAFNRLGDFGYVGVFSSGLFELGRRGPGNENGPSWEENHKETLDDPELKKGLRVVWFATGKEDFLRGVSEKTVELLKKHDFDVTYKETAGGHTWINWRDYLREFAPLLFKQ